MSSNSRYIMSLAKQIGQATFAAKASNHGFKVAVLGAAGGIGQPLSMLMKVGLRLSPLAVGGP